MEKFTREEIKAVNIKKNMRVKELVESFSGAGFGAGILAKACEISVKMIKDKDCKVFFGFAGAMVPAGMKMVVIEMLKNKWIDVFVSTGANLTHDLIEALGYNHYKGTRNVSDEELNKRGIDRIYDVFMSNEVYTGMEDFFNKHFEELKEFKSTKEFLWKLGSLLPKNSDSLLRVCYEKKIPIFCPALSDSGIGLMIWNKLVSGGSVGLSEFEDLKEIIDISWTSKKRGVFYVGGGVPKNYIQQAMQFTKGASYGVQVTLDRVDSGGSSGAELKEGISWGKLEKEAKFADLRCDATIALPVIVSYVKDSLQ